jgi:hypothetical protein
MSERVVFTGSGSSDRATAQGKRVSQSYADVAERRGAIGYRCRQAAEWERRGEVAICWKE